MIEKEMAGRPALTFYKLCYHTLFKHIEDFFELANKVPYKNLRYNISEGSDSRMGM